MNYLLILFFLFLPLAGFAQPHPDLDQTGVVDFEQINAEVSIFPHQKKVEGVVDLTFQILSANDSIFLDAKNMDFKEVLLDGSPVKFNNDQTRLWIISNFKEAAQHKLSLEYAVNPKQAMYFINWNAPSNAQFFKQVWTQGQGRYTSHWLPVIDDQREKTIFNLNINFATGYEVISNGELKNKIKLNDSVTQWVYKMDKPMSSYLVAIAAGKYEAINFKTNSQIPVSLYYNPVQKHMAEPTYRHSRGIFDFLEMEIGYLYPWQNYKQVPVLEFLYSGMENTGATIFANSLVVDSIAFNDQNYVNVNAHELAHQWFGNLVTAAGGEHHWLHEGFATYFALLAEKEIFGEEYYYWKLYQSAEELKALSDRGKGDYLLNPNASSLIYYQKGAWALHILREKVGDRAFKDGIKNFLEKYAYGLVSTNDFIEEMKFTSGMELDDFYRDWLQQSAFQGTAALNSLKESAFIRNYMEISALRQIFFDNKKEILAQALNFPVNDYIGQEVVFQLAGETGPEVNNLYHKAFKSENLYVRQAIAMSVESIPEELKGNFISLLKDDSYLTKEHALLKLWLQYPDEVDRWVELTEDVHGFSNKNVRLLWLVINLVSPGVNSDRTEAFFNELSGYTAVYYPFELRQNAFGYLYQINAFTPQNLIDLIRGAQHHHYRFRDFSRKLLETLLRDEEYRKRFLDLQEELDPTDRNFLNTRLNPAQ